MNNVVKNVIIFMSGAAVGATGMYLGVKKYFELKADLEIEDVRKVYEDKINEELGTKSSADGDIEGPKELEGERPLTHKEIIERMNNKPDLHDYTRYFKEKGERIDGVTEALRDAKEAADLEGLSEEELAEMEHPQDDISYTDEEDREESLNYIDHELNGASRDAIAEDKDPYEIEASDFELTCSSYDKISLTYYMFDQIVANDDEEVVDEAILIGDVIESSGFSGNEDDILFVRNDKIMADFEITKVYEPYGREKI